MRIIILVARGYLYTYNTRVIILVAQGYHLDDARGIGGQGGIYTGRFGNGRRKKAEG